MSKKEYDIVFWTYIASSVDRILPLMVRLKKDGIRTLLFYQSYDMSNNGSGVQLEIIKKYGLEVQTYGSFLGKSFSLSLISRCICALPEGSFLRNKACGFMSRNLVKAVDEKTIYRLFETLGHKLNIFDTIRTDKKVDFPVGIHYIKKISDKKGMHSIAIPHGVRVYYKEDETTPNRAFDFDTVIVGCRKEIGYMAKSCREKGTEIVAIGDPRFDAGWKRDIAAHFKIKPEFEGTKKGGVLLYIVPAFEQMGLAGEKDEILDEIFRIVKQLEGVKILIRPHPRWRDVGKIKKIALRRGIKDYKVIDNDPLLLYKDEVDIVLSPASSALFDFLPEMHEKIVIYDRVDPAMRFSNIFKGKVALCSDKKDLEAILVKKLNERGPKDIKKDKEVELFCNEYVADGGGTDTIIERYVDLIKKRLRGG